MKKRIAVNILGTSTKTSGNKTHILNVLREMLTMAGQKYEWCLLASGDAGVQMLEDEVGDFRPKIIKFPNVATNAPARILTEQAYLPIWLKRNKIDVLFATRNLMPLVTDCPTVIGIHSMHLNVEQEKAGWKKRYGNFILPRSADKADAFVAVSEYAGDTYRNKYQVPSHKMHVAPHGFEPSSIDVAQTANPLGDGQAYLLFVSTLWPHKNVPFLLDVFAQVAKQQPDLKLAIVGRDPSDMTAQLQAKAAALGVSDAVSFLGSVTNEELHTLYHHAQLFVFPSLIEGFGLPVLEAMSYGKPAVTSDRTSIPEVVGDAGVVLDPTDAPLWAEQITKILTNSDYYQQLSTSAFERAKQYTWQRSAEITLNALEKVLETT